MGTKRYQNPSLHLTTINRYTSTMKVYAVTFALWLTSGHGFLTTQSSRHRTFVSKRNVLFNDFEEFEKKQDESPNNGGSSSSSSSADLYAALRARQADFKTSSSSFVNIDNYKATFKEGDEEDEGLEDEEAYFLDNWRDSCCSSTVRLTLDDWIRRIAVDTYPLAVCGTASGHLCLADLQEGEELDCVMNVHASGQPEDPRLEEQQQQVFPGHLKEALLDLYGQFDGGGVIALAMKDDWIVSSGREGGAHLCRVVGQEQQVYKGSRGGTSKQTKLSLQRLGKFRGLVDANVLITSIAFDTTGTLWMTGYDGILRAFDYEERDSEDNPLMTRQRKPMFNVDLGAPIVNLSINDELGCGVASTLAGLVIFSLEDGEVLTKWNPLVKKVRREFVRSAILLKDDSNPNQDEPPTWSVVCGGSRGSLFQRLLNVDRTGILSQSRPFLDQESNDETIFPVKMRPNHMGSVVALACPAPGLLVTGSLDGSIRVWDYAAHSTELESDEEDDDDDDDDEEDTVIELEAQYDDVQPNDSRPQCLYSLSGYKVWLGSICANSRRLITDGADNTIIVHSFENEDEVLFSEDDDDDDIEGFSFE